MPSIVGHGRGKFLRICSTVKSNFHEKTYQRSQENQDAVRNVNPRSGTIEIGDVNRKFAMPVKVTKVDKGELLFLDNANYEETIAKNPHLSGVVMNDQDKKSHHPVHLTLGAGEYAKVKTESAPKIGKSGEPVAELTKFGWIIMSPGKEPLDITNMLLTQTSHVDYEELCCVDVLGLSDTPTNDQRNVYTEFQEQLTRDEEGWYETGLPWRGNHSVLPNNREGSLTRLTSLNRKLKRQNLTSAYEEIIEEQREAGTVGKADGPCVSCASYSRVNKLTNSLRCICEGFRWCSFAE